MFPNVIGHEATQRHLHRALTTGRLAHAYLLVGPSQVGKRTLARALAQGFLCSAAEPPCGHCDSCWRMEGGHHPDFLELGEKGPSSGFQGHIVIEQVADLTHLLSLTAFLGKGHVGLLSGAERLTPEAANRLLKTLEEPPPGSLILLVSAKEEHLLPTIISRCQRLILGPLPEELIRQALEERWGASPQEAGPLAQRAQGRLGWAVAALRDPEHAAEEEARWRGLLELEELGLEGRLQRAGELAVRAAQDPQEVLWCLEQWQRWWESVLLTKAESAFAAEGEELQALRERRAHSLSWRQIVTFLRRIERTRLQWEQNVNPLLALETLALAAPTWQVGESRSH